MLFLVLLFLIPNDLVSIDIGSQFLNHNESSSLLRESDLTKPPADPLEYLANIKHDPVHTGKRYR